MRLMTCFTTLLALAAPDSLRAGGSAPVAEIVTFRLLDGTDRDRFIAAAGEMTPFLVSTGAVVSRTLSVDPDGLWTDHLIWTTQEAATDAAARIMQDPAAAPFMAMVDPETVTMRHAGIFFTYPPE